MGGVGMVNRRSNIDSIIRTFWLIQMLGFWGLDNQGWTVLLNPQTYVSLLVLVLLSISTT